MANSRLPLWKMHQIEFVQNLAKNQIFIEDVNFLLGETPYLTWSEKERQRMIVLLLRNYEAPVGIERIVMHFIETRKVDIDLLVAPIRLEKKMLPNVTEKDIPKNDNLNLTEKYSITYFGNVTQEELIDFIKREWKSQEGVFQKETIRYSPLDMRIWHHYMRGKSGKEIELALEKERYDIHGSNVRTRLAKLKKHRPFSRFDELRKQSIKNKSA